MICTTYAVTIECESGYFGVSDKGLIVKGASKEPVALPIGFISLQLAFGQDRLISTLIVYWFGEARNVAGSVFCRSVYTGLLLVMNGKGDNSFLQQTADGLERYGCVRCGRAYKHKCHLITHQRYECGKAPQFACPFCNHKAKQKSNLKKHIGLVHGDGQKFPCDVCGRTYKYKHNLNFHLRWECNREPTFQCPSCPWRAKVKSSLKRHMVTQHDQERMEQRFSCSCGKSYKHKQHLNHHERYECGKEAQFACQLCSYRARQKRSLVTHMVLAHNTQLTGGYPCVRPRRPR
ncbi:hypothetical protein J6590_014782 [Homalodisca vitripennis]|nr:hypothetical protein J6590_014782 [Homalodisca vitripennis]